MTGQRRKALVTGGAGFIGSHLCELLLDEGWEVWALDDLSTGALANVEHLAANSDFHLVVDSVLNRAIVNELVHKCDVVYHLAAAVGVRLIVERPVHTLVTNLEGTEVVLEHCNRFGKRVLIASTSEVYGDHRDETPLEEGAPRLRADDPAPLGVCRLEGDGRVPGARPPPGARARLHHRAALQHGRASPVRAVRHGRAALRGARAAGDPLEMFGDGKQTRCFCHVSDTIRALYGLMEHDEAGEIYNVGSTSGSPSSTSRRRSSTRRARRRG